MKKKLILQKESLKKRVLIFEDYEGMQAVYRLFAEYYSNVEVVIVDKAEDFKKFSNKELNRFDYIFVDYMLKGDMNGGQLIKLLKHRYKGFILGTSSEEKYNKLMIASGADDAVQKEYALDVLGNLE